MSLKPSREGTADLRRYTPEAVAVVILGLTGALLLLAGHFLGRW